MTTKQMITKETIQKIVELLNRSLRMEYSFVVHYPQVAQTLRNEETRRHILDLCNASVHHADVITDIIIHLRGQPDWSFDLFPEETDTPKNTPGSTRKEEASLGASRECCQPHNTRSAWERIARTGRRGEKAYQDN